MSIIYKPDLKHCRLLARAAKSQFPVDTNLFYTEDEAYRIYDANDDWFTYCRWELNMDARFEDIFLSYCAWCYELRDGFSDSNEHDECDARLHYSSEIGKEEQANLLTTEIVPKAPTSVISLIMSYL
jgi:hypothetical protein